MDNIAFLKLIVTPTRLRIINILLNGKICNSLMNELLNEDEREIEKSISQLKKYNIIHVEKHKQTVFYSLTNNAINHINTIQNLFSEICTGGIYFKDRKKIMKFKKNCTKTLL